MQEYSFKFCGHARLRKRQVSGLKNNQSLYRDGCGINGGLIMKLVWIMTVTGPEPQIWRDWTPLDPPQVLKSHIVLPRHRAFPLAILEKWYPLKVKDADTDRDVPIQDKAVRPSGHGSNEVVLPETLRLPDGHGDGKK